jgi:hypothetical protein
MGVDEKVDREFECDRGRTLVANAWIREGGHGRDGESKVHQLYTSSQIAAA